MSIITIEANHINFGGGYSLLELMLDYLEVNKIKNIVYLYYEEVIIELNKNNYVYTKLIKSGNIQMLIRNFRKRSNIIFFGNLPPFVKNKKSLVYFQNEIILKGLKQNNFNFKYYIFHNWLKYFINKTDFIACQTTNIANQLIALGAKKVSKMPFYRIITPNVGIKMKYDFCYVCSGESHKNLFRLFDAIELMIDKYTFNVAITIEKNIKNQKLIDRIELINLRKGEELIINKGFISKQEIIEIYQSSKALIFPSIKESLGLPLIEANMCNIKSLSSDLSFSHEVLNFPIVFNPYDSKSIASVMSSFLEGEYDNVNQSIKLECRLEDLINSVL